MGRLGFFLLLSTLSFARLDPVLCGTTREPYPLFHRPRPLAVTTANDRDLGNIAILEDSGGLLERLNQFNLDASTITFTPSAGKYRYAVSGDSYAPDTRGIAIAGLGDDDARELPLPFAFPFFGATYKTVWINSDGNLTFTAPENASSSRSAGRVTGGPPRIAALFDDLDPSRTTGGVRMFTDATSATFSWVAVPEYNTGGFGLPQTFQIRLYADGRIAFAYSKANPVSAVVGIAPGYANGQTSIVSFKNDPSADYSAAVIEPFGSSQEIDIVLAAQRFYQTHEDAYDYLVIYNNEGVGATAGALAYESTVRSSGTGWGATPADNGRQFGSPSRLQAVLNMGPHSLYPRDPNGIVPARGSSQDTPLTVLGHEAGHLFLALASVRDTRYSDPNDPRYAPMLGFGGVHWAFTFNSEASLDEGEQITDAGPGATPRFATTAVTQGYSPLDQYLMGLRPPADVPPTFAVTDYTTNVLPTFHPALGVTFDGVRRTVTVDDVIAAKGRRTPDSTVAQRRYRFAFILVVRAGSEVPPEDLQQIEAYRQQFPAFFAKATSGNATADTTLNHSMKLDLFPAAGILAGGTSTATITVQPAPRADLTIQLQTPKGFAQAPATVRIAAGSTSATFALTGTKLGVEELLAVPSDLSYETAAARVQVADASLAKFTAVSTSADTIVVQLTDINRLPYPGARLIANGAVTTTDATGMATFHWSGTQLKITPEAQPSLALTFNGGSTTPTLAAVVNAASFVKGMAPGAIATAFGTNLADAKVTVAGVPTTVFFANDTQINFYVPSSTPVGTATVTAGPASLDVPVSAVQPGIFGILVRDGYLEIYGTGIGGQTPTVFFGVTPGKVLYSGIAPGFLGLDQINVAIPSGVKGTVPIVVSVGSAASNTYTVALP